MECSTGQSDERWSISTGERSLKKVDADIVTEGFNETLCCVGYWAFGIGAWTSWMIAFGNIVQSELGNSKYNGVEETRNPTENLLYILSPIPRPPESGHPLAIAPSIEYSLQQPQGEQMQPELQTQVEPLSLSGQNIQLERKQKKKETTINTQALKCSRNQPASVSTHCKTSFFIPQRIFTRDPGRAPPSY